jgi:hypothetical protein
MIAWVINSLRAFKAGHDLAFSDEPFYVKSRQEFKQGAQAAVAAAKEGYRNPAPRERLIRKPFRILLAILIAIFVIAVMFGGRF